MLSRKTLQMKARAARGGRSLKDHLDLLLPRNRAFHFIWPGATLV
jgi:hypothetical protein